MRRVREIIAALVADKFADYTFQYGRVQDINKYAKNVDKLIWLFPPNVSNGTNSRARLNRTFNVVLAFLSIDKISADNVEHNAILEYRFDDAEKFLIELYFDAEENSVEPQEPYSTENVFLKASNGLFTGVQLSFSVTLPDQLDIC